jgi:hypothetical protein
MKIQEKLTQLKKEAERLDNLTKLYPDLEEYTGRWERSVVCSVSVNGLVTDFDSRFNCGCCSDSPWEVWPYLKTPYGRVYSNPARFSVGTKYDHDIAIPDKDWKKDLLRAGIADTVIEKISEVFEQNRTILKDQNQENFNSIDRLFDNPQEESEPLI